MRDVQHLLDGRIPVVIAIEDGLGGVNAWSRRLKQVMRDHPKYNILMLECPVYATEVTGARDLCAPTWESVHETLLALRPAIVVPNYTWEIFNVCADLIERGLPIRTIGFCRTDEELYYAPLAWFDPLIAQFAAVSPECARKLAERMPARKDDIWTMPTGVFVPPALGRAWQTAPIRLIYGGRMSQVQKRVLDFVPLAEHLLARGIDFTLDLVGGGSQVEKLQSAFAAMPHGGRVRLIDAIPPEAMPAEWRARDVFLQASEYEGTSNSMLESMAEGAVPIVTDASSGIRSVIADGENGYIVPVGDMAAMADRIALLAREPARLEAMGRAAHAKAGEYSMERYAEKFARMLDRALEEPVRRWTRDEPLSPEIEKTIRKIRRSPGLEQSPTPRAVPMSPPPPADDPIVLVAAADDNFAMPLAVMVASVLANLAAGRTLRLFVLDGGITPANKERLARSWQDTRLSVTWLSPDLSRLKGLKVGAHINAVAYCRLLAAGLLRQTIEKAIYLDCDVIVERDLGEMWSLDVRQHALLAVQDMTYPYFDSAIALPTYSQCAAFLTGPRPIRRYQQLGIPPNEKYLNSGVLVLNLARWREHRIAAKIFDYLEKHKTEVVWLDQDGINVVLHDDWASMDERWNQIPHIFRYPAWFQSPFAEETFARIQDDPWIIHFSTRTKPWHHDGAHPAADRFYHYLDLTDWNGWRPPRPENLLQNPGFEVGEGGVPRGWRAPHGGGFTTNAAVLAIAPPGGGKNSVLAQRVSPKGDIARQRLLVTLRARADEPAALGLNVSLYVDGKRRAFSRNHPGDGRWHVLRHELDLPIGADPASIEVLITLRSQATRPAEITAPLAAIVQRGGAPFRHTLATRILAALPNDARRLLRRLAKEARQRLVELLPH